MCFKNIKNNDSRELKDNLVWLISPLKAHFIKFLKAG